MLNGFSMGICSYKPGEKVQRKDSYAAGDKGVNQTRSRCQSYVADVQAARSLEVKTQSEADLWRPSPWAWGAGDVESGRCRFPCGMKIEEVKEALITKTGPAELGQMAEVEVRPALLLGGEKISSCRSVWGSDGWGGACVCRQNRPTVGKRELNFAIRRSLLSFSEGYVDRTLWKFAAAE